MNIVQKHQVDFKLFDRPDVPGRSFKAGETIVAPPGFMLIASYNPSSRSILKELKPSFRQRFVEGEETDGVVRQVRDNAVWRWFFGRDHAFVVLVGTRKASLSFSGATSTSISFGAG